MEFSLLKKTEDYEIKYQGKSYLMKIINDEQTMTDSVLLYGDSGQMMDDAVTQEVYEQFVMES